DPVIRARRGLGLVLCRRAVPGAGTAPSFSAMTTTPPLRSEVPPDTAAERIAFLRGLRAVRPLRPDPLPETVLHNILEVGRWSGSAGNRQPWEFVVIRDRDTLNRLATIDGANAGHLATAAAGIAIVIRREVPDLDAYDERRLAERILLAASAHGVGAAVGHFTGPGETWAAS